MSAGWNDSVGRSVRAMKKLCVGNVVTMSVVSAMSVMSAVSAGVSVRAMKAMYVGSVGRGVSHGYEDIMFRQCRKGGQSRLRSHCVLAMSACSAWGQ